MSITTQELQREFKYNSVKLADPNPSFTLAQVRDFFANVYPEITSADIEGPEVVGNKNIYSFRRAVGTKGNLKRVMEFGAGRRFVVVAPVANISKLVTDLAELDRINWFHSEPRALAQIRRATNLVANGLGPMLEMEEQAFLHALHKAHCSRTQDARA